MVPQTTTLRRAPNAHARSDAISHLVGNTPLIAIDLVFDGTPLTVYTKLESMNMTGSVKDRMALHVLRCAYDSGALWAVVATVFADSNKKYLSTDLMKEEPARESHLTPRVSLRAFSVLARRCEFCPPSAGRGRR